MRHLLFILLTLTMIWTVGCSERRTGLASEQPEPERTTDPAELVADTFQTSDLKLFELMHRVKRAYLTTYYKVDMKADGTLDVDTAAESRIDVTIFFDSLGHYVCRRGERVKRDGRGNIVRWEDRRPNLGQLHGGFLKDTLRYTELSPGVLESEGMGDYAVAVRDQRGNIMGQFAQPMVDGTPGSCFNVYRYYDPAGNWTERLTIWVTASDPAAAGARATDSVVTAGRPHVSYSLTRRTIVYH